MWSRVFCLSQLFAQAAPMSMPRPPVSSDRHRVSDEMGPRDLTPTLRALFSLASFGALLSGEQPTQREVSAAQVVCCGTSSPDYPWPRDTQSAPHKSVTLGPTFQPCVMAAPPRPHRHGQPRVRCTIIQFAAHRDDARGNPPVQTSHPVPLQLMGRPVQGNTG